MRRTLVALGSVAVLAGAVTPGALAAKKPTTPKQKAPVPKSFDAVETGVRLSTSGPRYEDTYKVKQSPFGEGTVIRDAVLTTSAFPATGADTAKTYDRGGRYFAKETYTLGTPNVDGVGAIAGKGVCTSGTGTHHGETCTYTIKGHYDLITGITSITLSGTYPLHTHKRVK